MGVDAARIEKASSELVILPSGADQHLAWRVIVSKKGLIDGTWLVYIDAKKKGGCSIRRNSRALPQGQARL